MSSKTPTSRRYKAYRAARRRLRNVIPIGAGVTQENRMVTLTVGSDWVGEISDADLALVAGHRCISDSEQRRAEAVEQGMTRALTEFGRALYGPTYNPSDTVPVAKQVTAVAQRLILRGEQIEQVFRGDQAARREAFADGLHRLVTVATGKTWAVPVDAVHPDQQLEEARGALVAAADERSAADVHRALTHVADAVVPGHPALAQEMPQTALVEVLRTFLNQVAPDDLVRRDRQTTDRTCRTTAKALGINPVGWNGILAVSEDLVATIRGQVHDRERNAYSSGEQTAVAVIANRLGLPLSEGDGLDVDTIVRRIADLIKAGSGDRQRDMLQELHNHLFGPDETGEHWSPLPDDITVGQFAQHLLDDAAAQRRSSIDAGAAQVLHEIGAPWPQEWADQPVTVDRVVAAIRSYYTEQPQGQAVREARAAERANILGQLGITVNPGAAPGTNGAVAQIRNWAGERGHIQLIGPVTAGPGITISSGGAAGSPEHRSFTSGYQTALAHLSAGLGLTLNLGDDLTTDVVAKQINERGQAHTLATVKRSLSEAIAQGSDERQRMVVSAGADLAATEKVARASIHNLMTESEIIGIGRVVREVDGHHQRQVNVVQTQDPGTALARAAEALHPHPAVRRYNELRRRHSAMHDATEHTATDFRDTVLALLLGPDDRVMRTVGSSGDAPIYALLAPKDLWHLGPNRLQAWSVSRPLSWLRIEAAALLMCAADRPAEDKL